tara:strand:- start:2254 stop:2877 length:624 start_codon:yes stop_codon:yes gene_type:complete
MTGVIDYGLDLQTAAAAEPLTAAECRSHLNLDETYYDTTLDNLVIAARQTVESVTGRQLITATYDLTLDKFPAGRKVLPLPKGQLQSVSAITYTDTAGISATWTASDYIVSTKRDPGSVTPDYDKVWPSARSVRDAVQIRFVAGYGDAASDVPQAIKQAILLLVGHLFENREAVLVGVNAQPLPMAVDSLLAPYSLGDQFTWYGQGS